MSAPEISAPETEGRDKILIRYPRFKELHQLIRQCQQMTEVADEPQCMALEGVAGTGKTTLVWDYARRFPRRRTRSGVQVSRCSI